MVEEMDKHARINPFVVANSAIRNWVKLLGGAE